MPDRIEWVGLADQRALQNSHALIPISAGAVSPNLQGKTLITLVTSLRKAGVEKITFVLADLVYRHRISPSPYPEGATSWSDSELATLAEKTGDDWLNSPENTILLDPTFLRSNHVIIKRWRTYLETENFETCSKITEDAMQDKADPTFCVAITTNAGPMHRI